MNTSSLCNYTNDDLAKLILRLMVGFLMLFHGIAKVSHGVDGMMVMLGNNGIPEFIAYGVYIGEIVAPLMLILGYRVKLAAIIMIGMMIFILAVPYADKIFTLTKNGSWAIELHMFYIMSLLSIFFLGAGKYSISKK